MNGDLLGVLVGLAATVLPIAVCAWWGIRADRRARALREALEALGPGLERLTVALRGLGMSFQEAATPMARFAAELRAGYHRARWAEADRRRR